MIELTGPRWAEISQDLAAIHGRSTLLIRDRMRRELGFTVRLGPYEPYPNKKVYLDFFDDSAETFFRMKYL